MLAIHMPAIRHRGLLESFRRRLAAWLAALSAGQDGPAGQLSEDLAARHRYD